MAFEPPPAWHLAVEHRARRSGLIMNHPRFELTADYFPRRIGFHLPKPAVLSHFFVVEDFVSAYLGGFLRLKIAPPEWAAVVTTAEPTMKEWYPILIQFDDGVVEGYRIAIENYFSVIDDSPRYSNPIDMQKSHPIWYGTVYPPPPENAPKPLVGVREVLETRKWAYAVPSPDRQYYVAAREVASELNKLILPRERKQMSFVPIALPNH